MNLALVEIAISNRITTDTGSGGLWETDGAVKLNAIGFDVMPAGIKEPYVQCSIIQSDEDDTYEADAWNVDLEFEVVTRNDSERPTLAGGILNRVHARFHRWQPTVAGYNVTPMQRRNGTTAHDTEYRRYVELYTFRMESTS